MPATDFLTVFQSVGRSLELPSSSTTVISADTDRSVKRTSICGSSPPNAVSSREATKSCIAAGPLASKALPESRPMCLVVVPCAVCPDLSSEGDIATI
ncbi:hypothetical protein PF005_g10549 [Phytophthora fragariae]|uniref:Uncharacterized protein n=1 Tax=Phytophthora fragariae TaxID=53985 RepID=A0A6A3Y5J8_9STRA|nr:hypothetical protein PF005_g10549 [Phytophthora fragariae]